MPPAFVASPRCAALVERGKKASAPEMSTGRPASPSRSVDCSGRLVSSEENPRIKPNHAPPPTARATAVAINSRRPASSIPIDHNYLRVPSFFFIARFLPLSSHSSSHPSKTISNQSIPMASTAAYDNGAAWPSSKPPPHDARRRCMCVCLLVTLAVLLALAVTLLVLFLTVLRVRDPTTRLVSTRLAGVAPRLTFPALSIQLNVTLLLTVAVHNPNPASFAYGSGHTDLVYRGAQVGSADIDPGLIPSKGDGEVRLALTVQADRLAADIGQLVADVESGSVPMEASTRIPGRVTIFGVFKRHAVAYSDCNFVFGVAEMKVRSQECKDHTKL